MTVTSLFIFKEKILSIITNKLNNTKINIDNKQPNNKFVVDKKTYYEDLTLLLST